MKPIPAGEVGEFSLRWFRASFVTLLSAQCARLAFSPFKLWLPAMGLFAMKEGLRIHSQKDFDFIMFIGPYAGFLVPKEAKSALFRSTILSLAVYSIWTVLQENPALQE